jgi:DNA replication and repair protein RecF
MNIRSLTLKNYRNIELLSLNFCEGVNVFVGANGQGKTNVLESLYLLYRGQSFRVRGYESLIGVEQPSQALVQAKICKADLAHEVHIALQPKTRSLKVNDKSKSSSFLTDNYPCVLFSPESLAAIKSGPEQRRHLVDELLVSILPQGVSLQREYKKALKTRNRLLKNHKVGVATLTDTLDVLESLEKQFLSLATELAGARIAALKTLEPNLREIFHKISRDASKDISVDYVISSKSAMAWEKDEVYQSMERRLCELRKAELDVGISLVGPHKHDIRFLFDFQDSRHFCSQGQQRALILAFKMAQIMYHYKVHQEYPFLMLDDVLSELDAEKRESLIEFLTGIDSQIFLTTTDLDSTSRFKGRKTLSVYEVNAGRVSLIS